MATKTLGRFFSSLGRSITTTIQLTDGNFTEKNALPMETYRRSLEVNAFCRAGGKKRASLQQAYMAESSLVAGYASENGKADYNHVVGTRIYNPFNWPYALFMISREATFKLIDASVVAVEKKCEPAAQDSKIKSFGKWLARNVASAAGIAVKATIGLTVGLVLELPSFCLAKVVDNAERLFKSLFTTQKSKPTAKPSVTPSSPNSRYEKMSSARSKTKTSSKTASSAARISTLLNDESVSSSVTSSPVSVSRSISVSASESALTPRRSALLADIRAKLSSNAEEDADNIVRVHSTPALLAALGNPFGTKPAAIPVDLDVNEDSALAKLDVNESSASVELDDIDSYENELSVVRIHACRAA